MTEVSYQKPPAWLADFLEPTYGELKALAERVYPEVVAEAQRRSEKDPALIGVMALIGLGVQANLQMLAKGIARQPHLEPIGTASRLSMDVHNSTIFTFMEMCRILGEAQGATQQ